MTDPRAINPKVTGGFPHNEKKTCPVKIFIMKQFGFFNDIYERLNMILFIRNRTSQWKNKKLWGDACVGPISPCFSQVLPWYRGASKVGLEVVDRFDRYYNKIPIECCQCGHIDGLWPERSISSALEMEILLSCTKPSISFIKRLCIDT